MLFKGFVMLALDSSAKGTCTKKVLVQHEDTVPVSFMSGGDMGSDMFRYFTK